MILSLQRGKNILNPLFFQIIAEGAGAVCLVSNKCFRLISSTGASLPDIRTGPFCRNDSDRHTMRIHIIMPMHCRMHRFSTWEIYRHSEKESTHGDTACAHFPSLHGLAVNSLFISPLLLAVQVRGIAVGEHLAAVRHEELDAGGAVEVCGGGLA